MVEIVDQATGRGQHGAGEIAETVERRDTVDRLQACLAIVAGKGAAVALDDVIRAMFPAFAGHDLARAQARGDRAKHVGCAFLQHHFAGRNIAARDANGAAHFGQRDQQVGAARFEQRFFGQRACGHEADDVALHQRLRYGTSLALGAFLRFFGRFDLLGNRDAASGLDQAGEVTFGRMHRHAAHGDGLAAVLPPRSQRDVEDIGGFARVFEEQFEEIAHAIEQQATASLLLQGKILFHHRGRFGL